MALDDGVYVIDAQDAEFGGILVEPTDVEAAFDAAEQLFAEAFGGFEADGELAGEGALTIGEFCGGDPLPIPIVDFAAGAGEAFIEERRGEGGADEPCAGAEGIAAEA